MIFTRLSDQSTIEMIMISAMNSFMRQHAEKNSNFILINAKWVVLSFFVMFSSAKWYAICYFECKFRSRQHTRSTDDSKMICMHSLILFINPQNSSEILEKKQKQQHQLCINNECWNSSDKQCECLVRYWLYIYINYTLGQGICTDSSDLNWTLCSSALCCAESIFNWSWKPQNSHPN